MMSGAYTRHFHATAATVRTVLISGPLPTLSLQEMNPLTTMTLPRFEAGDVVADAAAQLVTCDYCLSPTPTGFMRLPRFDQRSKHFLDCRPPFIQIQTRVDLRRGQHPRRARVTSRVDTMPCRSFGGGFVMSTNLTEEHLGRSDLLDHDR